MKVTLALQELLEKRNMSQRELERRTGMRFATINTMCKDHAKYIAVDSLGKICKALDCQVGDILTLWTDVTILRETTKREETPSYFSLLTDGNQFAVAWGDIYDEEGNVPTFNYDKESKGIVWFETLDECNGFLMNYAAWFDFWLEQYKNHIPSSVQFEISSEEFSMIEPSVQSLNIPILVTLHIEDSYNFEGSKATYRIGESGEEKRTSFFDIAEKIPTYLAQTLKQIKN